MYKKQYKIAITHGDCNGISYELLLKLFSSNNLCEFCTPIIYGSPRAATFYAKQLNLDSPRWNIIRHASAAKTGVVNIIDCVSPDLQIEPGVISPQAGEAALAALDQATLDVQQGAVDALVTCPIHKAAMPQDVFPYKGHTDYLAARWAQDDSTPTPLMILFAHELRVALLTTHLPLASVSALISPELLEEKVRTLEQSLIQDFGIIKPRIAVLAVNPHSGDQGLMGREEIEILTPTLQKLQQQGVYAFGPFAADGFFGAQSHRQYDGVLAMYHDQGLAPFKAIYMNQGVNFSAALPFVRTSPDHGTGFDIVGQGIASEDSLLSALYAAIDLSRNRFCYQEARKNPLPSLYKEYGNDNIKLATPTEDPTETLIPLA